MKPPNSNARLGGTSVLRQRQAARVHMFVEIPPHVSFSDFVRRAKGRSSRKIQQEVEHIRKRYLGTAVLGQGLLLNHFRQHHR